MKVQLLLRFADHDNHQAILREILNYAEDADDQLVQEAFKAIGSISLSIPASSQQCLNALLGFIQSKYDVIVGNAVLVLKSLVQHQAESFDSTRLHLSIIAKLAQRIEQFHHPQAKACVIWLVGQYAPEEPVAASPISGIASWAPDVLRRTTKTFITEPVIVKLQVLTLAAKLVTLAPTNQTLVLITRFVLSMSRYDADYDVRDRARSLLGLLRGVAPGVQEDGMDTELSGVVLRREQVRLVLFTGKVAAKPEDARKAALTDEGHALLGSLSVVTGREMRGDRLLPDWLEQGTESSLRATADDAPRKAVPTAFGSSAPRGIASSSAHASPVVLTPMAGSPLPASARSAFTDLDKFYEESESEESETSEGGSEEDSEESEAEASSAPETESDDEDEATQEAEGLLHPA